MTCMGVMIDTDEGTITIPPEKLNNIIDTVHHWLDKDFLSILHLKSILDLLLYVHKCVKTCTRFSSQNVRIAKVSSWTSKEIFDA